MNVGGISANEAYLRSIVGEADMAVFGAMELFRISGWDKKRIHSTLASLERKGIITRLKRGSYAQTEGLNEHLFRIATELVKPSYISFWTALSRYGFTEQQVMTVQLASPRQARPFSAGDFAIEVATLKPYRFYGYQKMNGAVIAEAEKALIDALFRPDLCGGIEEVAACLKRAWHEVNHDTLIEYALGFRNRSLVSRLGHLIESLGLEMDGIERLLEARAPIFVLLDSKGEKEGEQDRKWRVLVNHRIVLEDML